MRSASGYATALAGQSQDLEYPVQSPGRQSRMPVRHRGAGRYCARDADANARCVDACLWAQGSLGEAVLPVESCCARGADTDVTVRIVPQQSGIYYYHVQIEDEQGRRSNVLDGTRHIPPQWFKSTCRDSARDPVELPTDWVVRASSTSSTGRDCETTLDHLRTLGTSAGALYQRAIGGPQ